MLKDGIDLKVSQAFLIHCVNNKIVKAVIVVLVETYLLLIGILFTVLYCF